MRNCFLREKGAAVKTHVEWYGGHFKPSISLEDAASPTCINISLRRLVILNLNSVKCFSVGRYISHFLFTYVNR